MTIDLGSDFETVGGQLLPDMRLLTSDNDKALGLLASCVRRLMMPNGSLWFDIDAGLDMRDYLNDTESPSVAQQAINGELLKDERVAQVDTTIVVSPASWQISTTVHAKDGTVFELVFLVTADKAMLLTGATT